MLNIGLFCVEKINILIEVIINIFNSKIIRKEKRGL